MCAEVDLHDVIVLQYSGVPCVGRVVRGAVVERHAGREGESRLESVLLDEAPRRPLQLLTAVNTAVSVQTKTKP